MITNNKYVEVILPEYVSRFSWNFTIQITQIYNDDNINNQSYKVSRVIDNKFKVYGENGEFYWLVHGTRKDIDIEPDKKDVVLHGKEGPYRWVTKN